MLYCLVFDYNEILVVCIDWLSNKMFYMFIVINLMLNEFMLIELQWVFEIILGYMLEKKLFCCRILDVDLFVEIGNLKIGSNCLAKLYSVKKGGYDYIFLWVIEGVCQLFG